MYWLDPLPKGYNCEQIYNLMHNSNLIETLIDAWIKKKNSYI
jgi:hypothetical protein